MTYRLERFFAALLTLLMVFTANPSRAQDITAVGYAGNVLTRSGEGDWVHRRGVHVLDFDTWGLYAYDAQTAWLVGDSGMLVKTTNAGLSWTDQSPSTATFFAIAGFDDTRVWAVSSGIYHTGDGSSWSLQSAPGSGYLRGIAVVDASTVWVVGDYRILYTSNGGADWTSQEGAESFELRAVSAVDANTAFAVGRHGAVMKTTDAGATWTALDTGLTSGNSFTSVAAVDADNVWIASGTTSGHVLKTTDGGATWTEITTIRDGGTQIAALDAQTVWLAGGDDSKYLEYTDDGGATWTDRTDPYANYFGNLIGLSLPGSDVMWTATIGAATGVSDDAGITWSYNGVVLQGFDFYGDVGWAVGANVILKTTDAGATFALQSLPEMWVVNTVTAIDENRAVAGGASGRNYYTSDGGDSWVRGPDTCGSTAIGALESRTSGVVWAGCSDGSIYTSTDAGASWTELTTGVTGYIAGIAAYDDDLIWAVGQSGLVIKSENGGTDWTSIDVGTTYTLRAVLPLSSTAVWVAGGEGALGKMQQSTDGGSTWTTHTIPVTRGIEAGLALDTDRVYLASGPDGKVLYTNDAGASWETFELGANLKNISAAMEPPTPGLTVDPSPLVVHPNEEVTVALSAETVTDLYGVSLRLQYDDDYLTYTNDSATEGDFLAAGDPSIVFEESAVDLVSLSFSRTDGAGVTGSGSVGATRFTAKPGMVGPTTVGIDAAEFLAVDPTGSPLTLERTNATVTIAGAWPGDTDNDCAVAVADVLPIGSRFDGAGDARAGAGAFGWSAQAYTPWSTASDSFVDATGDGEIDHRDVLPIGVNFGRSRAEDTGCDSGAGKTDSFVEYTLPEVPKGTDMVVRVALTSTVEGLLGTSLEFTVDPEVLEVASVVPGAFLDDGDLISFVRIDAASGTGGAAFTRRGVERAVDGTGMLVLLHVRTKQHLAGGSLLRLNRLKVSQISGISDAASLVALSTAESTSLEETSGLPDRFELGLNWPNPFNPTTSIEFALPRPEHIRLSVYDPLGREIVRLLDEHRDAGRHQVMFDAGRLPSGVYLYTIRANDFRQTRRMVLLK